MLMDLREFPDGRSLYADVCVIGGGPAGLTAAVELSKSFGKVVLLESGAVELEPETQALFEGRDIGVSCDLVGGRLRMLGGATNHWGGRCNRLEESDFDAHAWIPNSGWPIKRSDLDPYYARAWALLGFKDSYPSSARIENDLKHKSFALRSDSLELMLWQYAWQGAAAPLNFASKYLDFARQSAKLDVILHANAVKLSRNDDLDRVLAVHAVGLDGKELQVSATRFVLACGGIENARVLLRGDGVRAVGNDHDCVGRFLMQHPRAVSAKIFLPRRALMESLSSDLYQTGKTTLAPVEVGLKMRKAFRESLGLVGADASFRIYASDLGKLPGLVAAKRLHAGLEAGAWPTDTGELYLDMIRDLDKFYDLAMYRLHLDEASKDHVVEVEIDLEQAPNRDSRVTLDSANDALGVPKVVTDWRIDGLTKRTAVEFTKQVAVTIQSMGLGRVRLEPWISESTEQTPLGPTNHYLGTTRMSEDPKSGVVDSHCKVHGVENLFVVGSSVFPTSGHVNPTLTILALSLRLADHLSSLAP